jgi:AraC-like DNA-binding protein
VRAYAGDVIATNPGEVHDGRPLGVSSRRWCILSVDRDAMASLAEGCGTDVEIARPVIADPVLADTLGRLFRRLERWSAPGGRGDADALACEESLVEACVLVMTRHGAVPSPAAAPDDDVRRVRDRLADAPLDAPTLAELAAMAGLSKYQVLRRFARVYGLPPHAWLLRLRAERARVLIRDGSPLSAAAAASGFADQSHMTRVFARQFGFTPGAWRTAVAPQPRSRRGRPRGAR